MSKTYSYQIKEQIAQDAAGTVYRAIDQSSGRRVSLRKYTHIQKGKDGLHAIEEVAYQVAIQRLSAITHPSLRPIISGGTDPDDDVPYIACEMIEAKAVQTILKETYLSVEMATTLLWQLLELSELLSQLLAEEGIWLETDVASIAVSGDTFNTRFVFWASPLKCLDVRKKPRDYEALITMTEAVMGWQGRRIEDREGGYLKVWLAWLREETEHSKTSIREIREMLSAAAGIEPPPPIDDLLAEAQRRRSWLEKLPGLSLNKYIRAPKMPLFAILTVMLVVQSIAGWMWIRKINADFDEQLKNIDLTIPERRVVETTDRETFPESENEPTLDIPEGEDGN